MNVIDLPLFQMSAPLDSALGAMRKFGRGAVIGQEESGFWLVMAGRIVVGLSKGKKLLGELPRQWPVRAISPADNLSRSLNLQYPHQSQSQFEGFLDQHRRFYALLEAHGGQSRIVTRHEWLAAEIGGGPKDCYCTNELYDPPHEFPPPPVPADRICPICHHPLVCI